MRSEVQWLRLLSVTLAAATVGSQVTGFLTWLGGVGLGEVRCPDPWLVDSSLPSKQLGAALLAAPPG